jgi:hypothetical protein
MGWRDGWVVEVVSLGLGATVGNYPDRCDICGRELDYSPKRLVTLSNGEERVMCICRECRDRLYPKLKVKCERCRHFKEREDLEILGECHYPRWCVLLVAKWDSCKHFEGI